MLSPLGAPRRIGPYKLERELGRGTSGVVFEARSPAGVAVAVKLLFHAPRDPEARGRFAREVALGARLRHPGLVTVLERGEHEGRPFIAMELVQGPTLQDHLRHGPLAPAEAARLVAPLARALEYAHAHGVVHRDVKPANVVLEEPSLRPRLADLGMARAPDLRSLTESGMMLGTPAYMAPETFEGRRAAPPVDVYGLGVILYECLTGRRPYEGRDALELAQFVRRGGAPPPAREGAVIPSELSAVCFRAIARDPAARPTAGQLADALEALVRGGPAAKPPSARVARARSARARVVDRPRPPAAAAAVAALVLVGGLGAALWFGATTAPPPAPSDAAPSPAGASSPAGATSPSPAPSPEAPPADPAPTPSPRPSAPPPELDEREAVELLQAALEAHGRGAPSPWLRERVAERLADHPRDSRVVLADAVIEFAEWRDEDVFAFRRRCLEALNLEPRVRLDQRALPVMLSYTLGFQRAAADLLALGPEAEGESVPAILVGHVFLRAEPPVHDPVWIERLMRDLLRRGPGAIQAPYVPQTFLAHALLAQGRAEEAAAALERVADLVPASTRMPPGFGAFVARIRRGQVTPYQLFAYVGFDPPDLPLLVRLHALDQEARRAPTALVARGGEAMAGECGDRLGPAFEAAILVQVARMHRHGAEPERSRPALERAWEVVQAAEAPDVRDMVARVLARDLLEAGEDPPRAEALALEAIRAPAPYRTRGELADAWVLIARARQARGDAEGAEEAILRAEAARPPDRREIDAFRRRR